jgi:type IV pilus assembly protein PilB
MAKNKPAGPGPGDDFQTAVNQVADDRWDRDDPDADASPIVRISHTIIQQAVNERASEIQIEPQAESLTVRFRVHGAVEEKMKLPVHVSQKLVDRYKYMADMNLDQQDQPQQGRISISHAGRDYDLDVRSEPAPEGERILIAIHEKA